MNNKGNNKAGSNDWSQGGAPAVGHALRDRFSADEIYQRLTATASDEMGRSFIKLFFSGFAAGMIIGATFIGRAAMTHAYPNDPVGLGNLLYPIGFITIVLGGYQLFTENTLTPVTLILNRRASIPALLRLWIIVLCANVSGAALSAFLLAHTGILDPDVTETAKHFGEHALSYSWSDLFFKAAIAGGNVATMVWLVHAARDTISRIFIIYIIMFMVPAANLFHCVTGSLEVMFLYFKGGTTLYAAFVDFFVPVVLGNIVGGIGFVALVNYGMTSKREIQHYNLMPRLNFKQWLLGASAKKMDA